jgi:hypothetical protein
VEFCNHNVVDSPISELVIVFVAEMYSPRKWKCSQEFM